MDNTNPSKKPVRSGSHLSAATPRFFYGVLIFLTVFPLLSGSPEKSFNTEERVFHIYYGKKHIGNLTLSETRQQENMLIQVESEVKARLLFTFTAKGSETYRYRNDTLISSDLYRKVNNRISLDQKLVRKRNGYELSGQDHTRLLPVQDVRINLTRLFLREPTGATRIFSDRFGQWVPLEKTGPHQYEVTLPNGSRTIFSYQDGICQEVLSLGTFYRVRLIPKN